MKKANVLPEIAQNIKYFRLQKNWSQAALGEKIGCTQQVIFTYERGIAIPPPATLAKLSYVFKISIDDLTGAGKNKVKKIFSKNPRLLNQLKLVEKLPHHSQKNVINLIKDLAKAYNIK